MATKYPPLRAIVPGYLYEGFTVLAGRQKLGKTGSASTGHWQWRPAASRWARSLRRRRRALHRYGKRAAPYSRPHQDAVSERARHSGPVAAGMGDRSAATGSGLYCRARELALSVPIPTLVVIDVLQRIKPAGSMARNAYENDYSAWAPLQHWATEKRVAVLGLHHTKKGGADDPLEALSGSNGLSACADTTIVLDQDQNGRTLYVRGRDVEEKETAVIFAGGFGRCSARRPTCADRTSARLSSRRSTITARPMTPSELATALGKQSNNIKQLLFKMAKAGEVYRRRKGPILGRTVHPHNPDNRDNHEGTTMNDRRGLSGYRGYRLFARPPHQFSRGSASVNTSKSGSEIESDRHEIQDTRRRCRQGCGGDDRTPAGHVASDRAVGTFSTCARRRRTQEAAAGSQAVASHDVIHAPTADLEAHRAMLRAAFGTLSEEFADTMMGKIISGLRPTPTTSWARRP